MKKKLNISRVISKTSNKNDDFKKNNKNGDILNAQFSLLDGPKSEKAQNISFYQLFRYSTSTEKLIIFLALFFGTIGAILIPYSVIIYGEFTSLLIDRVTRKGTSTQVHILKLFGGGRELTNGTIQENRDALIEDSIAFGLSSAAGAALQFIVLIISVDIINITALNQITRIRKLFLEAVLKQDMIWYDVYSNDHNFATKMTEDLDKFKEGIGEKIIIFWYLLMTFVTSVICSFFYGWELTLVVLSCVPIIVISTALVAKIQSSLTEKELKSYSRAGAVAEEVFSGIRTVVAFSGEKKEEERYANRLIDSEKTGYKKGFWSGTGSGIMWFITYCSYALALWYGVVLIIDEDKQYTPAILVIVLFGVLIGAQNLGLSSPHIEAFSVARGAAANIFSIIDRKPIINSLDDSGIKPKAVTGNIRFENIEFRYPSRPDIEVLKGLTLEIESGKTTALVGPSGCGKSTCLQLFQRLYDPMEGNIKLDGYDIKTLNVAWLRSNIGVVGQEPVLFATTIAENIRYGRPNATQAEIEDAAKIANCHTFITKLPQGYDTMVGQKGAQMSGGQKQRIAIARAVIKNPSILLLDEATSALDPTSEKKVQQALEEASVGRTTLVVSHRLSTITNADKIVYIKEGQVLEQGSHEELMKKKGYYYDLVNTNKKDDDEDDEEDSSDESQGKSEAEKPHRAKLESNNSVLSAGEDNEAHVDEEELYTKNEKYKVSFMRLMKLNKPEWPYILVGGIAAILHGSSLPIFAILFGEFYGILSNPDKAKVQEDSNFYSYLFIALGVLAGVGSFFQFHMFNKAGVSLTSRLRKQAFKAIISQEMAFFDEKVNSIGALCSRLSGDCANVQGATGSRIGAMVQSIATLVIGILISFYFSWDLTLITMITIPFVLGSIFLESRYMDASTRNEKLAIESASTVAVEAISNIRTVSSLGQEPHVLERYCKEIDLVREACKKKTRYRGLVFSLGQAAPFAAYGLSLYYGGTAVADRGLQFENVIKVSEALIFGSWMLGQALAYAPNVNAAIVSAGRLLRLFERQPKMVNVAPSPFNSVEKVDGDINYNNIQFRYPTRPEVQVLKGLQLTIKQGTTVALVGPSGCGKSTCVQLLLRYYDPDSGNINIGDLATTEFPLDTLRSQLGLVSQEPVLFDKTIAENIAYGDNFKDIPMAEIIECAKKANIHEFISNLPLGYETSLGNKGAQLSGGQKQRIAIARALVRNPKILILDEATSALDMQSERIVQDALDAASAGRTCITIAHRLTTIQDSDVIIVIKNGVIIEKGTHDELMRMEGMYSELYTMQQIQ
ncbi:multidrug resistance protein homolog 49-like [Condylostylus longicornis]|uniref:multidrug resistance protein homolog 49-like n=1 Tax=Condylostylus longicornis TaxID=2530218 RepID=UPI00244E0419|nr:multidrug resistance protein homolog 49-like [Condylostylus longicornis]XP_055387507.1 multidrug resistance protein homolog 49-like [Condylostylus longicornis]